ncbi:hypothetical protein Gbro_4935 (plasmid) [Gordonia bronchialis DSM 43247]|uniref:Uncharacterized protein n=1 Tax=Gordonia bronchialis (strain ATCC 25592 / DSM 43247 / BCRC 13721 / JCM 3198 / KCTC 3076 / NBRC 16047 / NCTC 10667) TaxID=526226 RepID=D0LFJ9_GORB4|nr:hypothetical protein [Gordonia bronchialis]ACY24048.1 hypothetical protein Gbro_4935 [Gordonia bronchialis DSM 43247]MCC3326053.1 hypothetical protein [Gordonia bronchialis]QGS27365.1 hypothetical protein FOB84_24610 [Gordonia bronchialis]STS10790.1 Uncharacterised protein [Gordonia bronchialis]
MTASNTSPETHQQPRSRRRSARETARVARTANDLLNCRLLQAEHHSTTDAENHIAEHCAQTMDTQAEGPAMVT